MKKLKELWAALPETVLVTRREGVMLVTICTLIGVILGMLCSLGKNARYGCSNQRIYNWGTAVLPEEAPAGTDPVKQ